MLTAFGRTDDSDARLQALTEQNRQLEAMVQAQQKAIDDLKTRMAGMERATQQQATEVRSLQDRAETTGASGDALSGGGSQVRVSAEAGLAFFNTGADGQFPNAEFRVDDPVISIEAPVWKNTYLFSELKLLTREATTDSFQLGELYVDFEDISDAWGKPGLLSLRAGRINTPFGEEYQGRGPVENPLISHSLADIWGTDEGVEIYGSIGPARYVLAVQNGGISRLHDYNSDKAVVGRIGWAPSGWLHLSGSAMRTGSLSVTGDGVSDVWFANGFFRALGSGNSTTAFWADLAEVDGKAHWKSGHFAVAGGAVRFDDDDSTANNVRRMRFGYVELVQNIADQIYGAVRYSEIRAPHGYPLVGNGAAAEYSSRLSLTDELRRLSLGVGYRFGAPLVLKLEYSWNAGHTITGVDRDGENFFGTEIGVKF